MPEARIDPPDDYWTHCPPCGGCFEPKEITATEECYSADHQLCVQHVAEARDDAALEAAGM